MTDAAEAVLRRSIKPLLAGKAQLRENDLSKGSYFGGRQPEDGRIDWRKSAQEIHDLVRAVTAPWPGAFGDTSEGPLRIWRSRVGATPPGAPRLAPGQIATLAGRRYAGTGDGFLELVEFEGSA